MYKRERPCYAPRRKTPSFSSSLLEAVYRSIDESEGQDLCSAFYNDRFTATDRKQSSWRDYHRNAGSAPSSAGRRGFSSLERVMMIEEWMEKQCSGGRGRGISSLRLNSGSSSSSGSSSVGRMGPSSFSSSETESGCRKHKYERKLRESDDDECEKTKKKDTNENFGGGFSRTKLGALKIYRELKKVKQPISPGGKISAFLNSIFSSGNVKKAKMCYVGAVDEATFSSVSSLSRPCMSRTPSSRNLSTNYSSTNQPKRTTKFCPSQVVLDDFSESRGYRAVLRRCSSYKEKDFATMTNRNMGNELDVDDEDSQSSRCSSSDLFELDDHLIVHGFIL